MRVFRRAFPPASIFAAALLLFASDAPLRADAESDLANLLDEAWEFRLRESPLFATNAGDHRFNDRLGQIGVEHDARRLSAHRTFLERLEAIEPNDLSRDAQIDYDVFGKLTRDRIAEYEFGANLMPITNRGGFHISFPELYRDVPLRTLADHENYIARLNQFQRYATQHIELMRAGVKKGMVLPDISLVGYEEIVGPQIVKDPTDSLLFGPFKEIPDTVAEAEHERLREEARQAIQTSVVPGFREFLTFLRDEYVPAARAEVGASALPNGRDFYRHRVRRFTTLDLMPDEVHVTGLAEVQRIRNEMAEVIKEAAFTGEFDEFVEYLRSEDRFYPRTAEELMEKTARVLKKMDGELPKLFKTLPRMPYGIREVPAYIAPKTTTAYYSGPAGDGTRAGFYYVNTYNLKSRPLYQVEALSLHEAVPGHHLQIALQQELDNLRPFRRFADVTAFIEGWGLYSERLGLETGFYQDPYSNFGRLSYEMWRACRLVVDTGMHYLGWTRQQAIEFMAANTALSIHNITAEVDRYISWPGQALAYKIGELKIRQLRERAEKELESKFDIREFHDVVLRNGAIPLDVLESEVLAYIKQTK